MSLLANGIELIELGATAWRDICNANFSKFFTKTEVNALITTVNTTIDALKDVPQRLFTSPHTLELVDRGVGVDTTANVTIPLASTVAFPNGSVISVTNMSVAPISILTTSGVTLRIAGTADTGDCTLALYGMATMRKVATNTWHISGAGVALAEV